MNLIGRNALRSVVILAAAILAILTPPAGRAQDAATLAEKTLVVWAAPGNLTQHGGSALTLDEANPDAFDAIVFAERRPATWMAGSSGYRRSNLEQDDWLRETAGPDEFVAIANPRTKRRFSGIVNGRIVPVGHTRPQFAHDGSQPVSRRLTSGSQAARVPR